MVTLSLNKPDKINFFSCIYDGGGGGGRNVKTIIDNGRAWLLTGLTDII